MYIVSKDLSPHSKLGFSSHTVLLLLWAIFISQGWCNWLPNQLIWKRCSISTVNHEMFLLLLLDSHLRWSWSYGRSQQSYNFDFSFQHSLPMRRQSSFYCFYLFSFIVLFILFPFLCFKRNQLFTHWLLIESCTGLGVDLILFSVFQIFLVAGLKKKKDISVDWSGDFYFLYRLFAAYIYVD